MPIAASLKRRVSAASPFRVFEFVRHCQNQEISSACRELHGKRDVGEPAPINAFHKPDSHYRPQRHNDSSRLPATISKASGDAWYRQKSTNVRRRGDDHIFGYINSLMDQHVAAPAWKCSSNEVPRHVCSNWSVSGYQDEIADPQKLPIKLW